MKKTVNNANMEKQIFLRRCWYPLKVIVQTDSESEKWAIHTKVTQKSHPKATNLGDEFRVSFNET